MTFTPTLPADMRSGTTLTAGTKFVARTTMPKLTCCYKDWLAYEEDFESITILGLPVSICPEDLLFSNYFEIAQREAWCRARYMSVLEPRLPVGAVADNLHTSKSTSTGKKLSSRTRMFVGGIYCTHLTRLAPFTRQWFIWHKKSSACTATCLKSTAQKSVTHRDN